MAGVRNVSPREAILAFGRAGRVFRREKGSHYIMAKEGVFGLIVIPMHEGPLRRGTLRALLRVANITAEQFENLL